MGHQLYHKAPVPMPPSESTGEQYKLWAEKVTEELNSLSQAEFDIHDYGAVGNALDDDSDAFRACIDDVLDKGGGTIRLKSGYTYYIGSTVTAVPVQTKFIASGAPGHGNIPRGACVVRKDNAGHIFDFGDANEAKWAGPHFENITFEDSSTTGACSGALYFRRMNMMSINNCNFSNFTDGDAITFDSSGGWCQYITIMHPRIRNCKVGIKKVGNLNDVQIFGGQFRGVLTGEALRPDSRAIWDSSGSGGRLAVYRTSLNDWDIGIDIQAWQYGFLNSVHEQSTTNASKGTGIWVRGTACSTDAYKNIILGAHVGRYAVGISVDTQARRTQVFACTLNSCDTDIQDDGVNTTIVCQDDFQLSGETVRIKESRTPASGTASGLTGNIVWDTNYVYVCTSTDSWSRATLETF